MKLIFLDVDGVLNTTRDHERMSRNVFWVQEPLVELLCRIIVETGARVVISSTWRYSIEMVDYIIEQLGSNLAKKGYNEEFFLSCTPDLSETDISPQPMPETWHQTRTDEIILWLRENVESSRSTTSDHDLNIAFEGIIPEERWILEKRIDNVESFICLDDMKLDYYSCYRLKSKIKQHLIHTTTSTGLTPSHVKAAISVLQNPWSFEEWAKEVYVPCDKLNCVHKDRDEVLGSKQGYKRGKAVSAAPPLMSMSRTQKAHMSARTLLREKRNIKKNSESVMSGYEFVL